ncbi:adenosine deaminase/editase [Paraphysoderma sedebokerense]|nr:adenosine deaminase/editase [Paraphysoderma sedebokerense]
MQLPSFDTERITTVCLQKFAELPRRGKPAIRGSRHEWTVLAGIVKVVVSESGSLYECVSLGTGLKCLGFSKVSSIGDIVHDSHAEVICRRSFNLYLLQQIRLNLLACSDDHENNRSIFEMNNETGKLKLRHTVSFHLYISHAPCGDASTVSLANSQTEDCRNRFLQGRDQLAVQSEQNLLFEQTNLNIKRGRIGYDIYGVLRTKPGRLDSEATHSMSCSDKIARWNVLGIQMGILAPIIEPVYLKSIVVGDHFHCESLDRALKDRIATIQGLPPLFVPNELPIFSTTSLFDFGKEKLCKVYKEKDLIPADCSIVWYKGCSRHDVLVNGRKQGAAPDKNGTFSVKSRSSISKMSIFEIYASLLESLCNEKYHGLVQRLPPLSDTYRNHKESDEPYRKAKEAFYANSNFRDWQGYGEMVDNFTLPPKNDNK